jgi:apolipoprotein N-acyltransferase
MVEPLTDRPPPLHLAVSDQIRLSEAVKEFGLPVLSGILLGLSFFSEAYSVLAWVALTPTVWSLLRVNATLILYVGTFCGGLVLSLIGLYWICDSYNGRFFESWLVLGHFLALFWVGAIWVGRRVAQATSIMPVIVLPMYWVAMESACWYVTGLAFADGFPLLQLGVTQSHHDRLIQIADLGGISAVSWMVVAVNAAAFAVLEQIISIRHGRRSRLSPVPALAIAGVLVVAAVSYGEWRRQVSVDEPGPTIALVSGTFNPRASSEAVEQFRRRILERLESHDLQATQPSARPGYPDLFVWKEGALSGFLASERESASNSEVSTRARSNDRPAGGGPSSSVALVDELHTLGQQLRSSFIVGCKRRERSGSTVNDYNSVVYLDYNTGTSAFYDKIHLSPVTEYRPKLAASFGILPPVKTGPLEASRFRHGHNQRIFDLVTASQCYRVAPMICYDLFFPAGHRRLIDGTNIAPAFFIGVANERGARQSTFPTLSSAMQKFRAIECGRAYVRNAEGGISQVLDGHGRPVPTFRVEIDDGRHTLVARVPISDRRTAYVRFGEWLPTLACTFSIWLFAVSLRRGTLRATRAGSALRGMVARTTTHRAYSPS